eukprot:g1900.t1
MLPSLAFLGIVVGTADPLLPARYFDHFSIVTNDTVSVAQQWADLLGIAPPSTFNNAGPAGNLSYHGAHTDANILGAFMDCIHLEILQPTDQQPSFWLDHYHEYGTSPFYLGFATNDWQEPHLDTLSASFAQAGCPTEQTGYWFNGDHSRGCYHYMDCADAPFGVNLEVMTRNNCYNATVGGRVSSPPRRRHGVRAASAPSPSAATLSLTPVLGCGNLKGFGIVVPNATKTVSHFAASFGQSVPDLTKTGATEYKGQASRAEALLGQLSLANNLFLHVYQPLGESPSWWHAGLQRYGPSVHLVSFDVPDLSAAVQQMQKRGYSVLQRGGDSWAFFDTMEQLGVVVEIF